MTEGDTERNPQLTASKGEKNPFVLNEPFSPEKILGRERLAQLIIGDSNTNWILSGESGLGKTSFLLYLRDQIQRQNERLPLQRRRLAIYINPDALIEILPTEFVNQFQLQIISGIEEAVAAVPELVDKFKQWEKEEESVWLSLSRSEEAKSLKRLYDLAEFVGSKTNLLLLIDDFDLFVSKILGIDKKRGRYYFSSLRAFFSLVEGLQVVITSSVSVEELEKMIPTGSLNIFAFKDLGGIKGESVDQILDRGNFSPQEKEEILRQAEIPEAKTGGGKSHYHPARLIKAASERYIQRAKEND